MSTKSTLAHADDFHFYTELFDERHVYLELRGVDFVAGRDRVTVPIPLSIWEVIRTLGGVEDLSLVQASDERLRVLAETDVDARIAAYQSDPDRESPQRAWFHSGADLPREEQVAEALGEYRASRQQQREIHAAIQAIRNENRSTPQQQRRSVHLPTDVYDVLVTQASQAGRSADTLAEALVASAFAQVDGDEAALTEFNRRMGYTDEEVGAFADEVVARVRAQQRQVDQEALDQEAQKGSSGKPARVPALS